MFQAKPLLKAKTIAIYVRQLIVIFILCFSINLFGQKSTEETFCSPADFVGFCLTFKTEKLFDYNYWTCTGDIQGNGNFIKSKNKLILNFTNPDTLQRNSISIKDTINSSNDSISLYFLIQEYSENEPIPFGNIVSYLHENKSGLTTTDMNGLAQIKLKKSNDLHRVKTVFLGYKPFTFEVKSNNCKFITIKLSVAKNNFIENGTIWKYKIRKETPDMLIVRKDGHNYTLLKQKE